MINIIQIVLYIKKKNTILSEYVNQQKTDLNDISREYDNLGSKYNDMLDWVEACEKENKELKRTADETKAEPLTQEERRILVRVAKKFPNKRMIIDAAHREEAWKKKSAGALMPYLDAFELTGI